MDYPGPLGSVRTVIFGTRPEGVIAAGSKSQFWASFRCMLSKDVGQRTSPDGQRMLGFLHTGTPLRECLRASSNDGRTRDFSSTLEQARLSARRYGRERGLGGDASG
jgi:hypothetical protein